MFRSRPQYSGNHHTIRRPHLQEARLMVQRFATNRCQFMPQTVAFQQQRHVLRVLKVRLPNDAGLAVRTATIVRRDKAVDADCAGARLCGV